MNFIRDVVEKIMETMLYIGGAIACLFLLLAAGVGILKVIGPENLNPTVALILLLAPTVIVTTIAIHAVVQDRRGW